MHLLARATTAPSVLAEAETAAQVRELVDALGRSDRTPAELVLAWTGDGEPPVAIENAPCPVHTIEPSGDDLHDELARTAHAEKLIFLPPGGVPGRSVVAAYEHQLGHIDALVRDAGDGLGVRRRTLLQRIGGFRDGGPEEAEPAAREAGVPVRRLHLHGRRAGRP
jgi:hypothetical protein